AVHVRREPAPHQSRGARRMGASERGGRGGVRGAARAGELRGGDPPQAGTAAELRPAFEQFRTAGWLDEFALFMAIKDAHGGKPWWEWPAPLARREPAALRTVTELLSEDIAAHRFAQFLFARQWAGLREHAHELGVR